MTKARIVWQLHREVEALNRLVSRLRLIPTLVAVIDHPKAPQVADSLQAHLNSLRTVAIDIDTCTQEIDAL